MHLHMCHRIPSILEVPLYICYECFCCDFYCKMMVFEPHGHSVKVLLCYVKKCWEVLSSVTRSSSCLFVLVFSTCTSLKVAFTSTAVVFSKSLSLL